MVMAPRPAQTNLPVAGVSLLPMGAKVPAYGIDQIKDIETDRIIRHRICTFFANSEMELSLAIIGSPAKCRY